MYRRNEERVLFIIPTKTWNCKIKSAADVMEKKDVKNRFLSELCI
jgi:hypothetical protein